MKKNRIGTLILFSCLFLLTAGCLIRPIHNIVNHPIPASNGKRLDMAQISQGVTDAGTKLGWVMTESSPGNITAFLGIRTHNVTVQITFNHDSYNIKYVRSTNLNHDGNLIHYKYNDWIERLARHIDNNLTKIANPEPLTKSPKKMELHFKGG